MNNQDDEFSSDDERYYQAGLGSEASITYLYLLYGVCADD